MRGIRTILAGIVVLAGWLITFGGVSLSCAKMLGPVAMVELWSDSATSWMFPASAVAVVLGATVIWLGSRLPEKKHQRRA